MCRYSQPNCPAMPTAQTDEQSLRPAGRHVRRPSRPPDRVSELPVSTGKLKMDVEVCARLLSAASRITGLVASTLNSTLSKLLCRLEVLFLSCAATGW